MKFFFKYLVFMMLFLLICEVSTKLFFPVFNENNIFYKKDEFFRVSKGIKTHFKKFNNLLVRVKNPDMILKFHEEKTIWFIGDSVTNGYGVEFEDTYYSVLDERLKKRKHKFNIFASGMYGNNYKDSLSFIKNLSNILGPGDLAIYQFNYNDLIDIGSQKLNFSDEDIPSRSGLKKFINSTNKFRYKYLNHSSFFKLIQHQASLTIRDIDGGCFERGLNALGPYTYAFFADGYQEKSELVWNEFKKDILNIKQIFDSKNIFFLIVIVPISIQLDNHEIINKLNYDLKCSNVDARKYLVNFLKNNKIDYVDTTIDFLDFEKKSEKKLFHSFDTNHPNDYGHKIISSAIEDELVKSYLNQ